jgi:hypothetical protein
MKAGRGKEEGEAFMSEHKTIICPNCAYGKELPGHAVPPDGTRAVCPKCKWEFFLSSKTMPRQQVSASVAEPPPVRQDPALRVNVGFETYPSRDNRFVGKGVVRGKQWCQVYTYDRGNNGVRSTPMTKPAISV